MVRSLLATFVLASVFASATASDVGKRDNWTAVEVEPDPSQSHRLDHCPNAADLARLESVEGKSKAVVLQVLGHPSSVERRRDGEEVWNYPWCAACQVWIRRGVCTGTFYTGGY